MDLEPLEDIFSQPAVSNARAGGKFQPKAKPQPRKVKHVTVPTNPTNAGKESFVIHQDTVHPVSLTQVPDRLSYTAPLTDSLPRLIQNQELVNSTEVFHPGLPRGDNNSAPVDIMSQHLSDREYLGSRDTLHSESTISISHGDLQSGFTRSGKETAEIFFGLDDIIHESRAADAVSNVRKFQPRVKVNTQPKDKLPASHAISVAAEGSINHDEAPKDLEGGPGLASLSTFDCPTLRRCSFVPTNSSSELLSQQTLSNRETGCFVYEEDFLFDAESLEREEQPFHGLESLNVISQTTTTGGAQSDPCEIENMDDYLHPVAADHDFVDLSTMNAPHPAVPDHPSYVASSEDLTHHVDASGSNVSTLQEVVEPLAVPIISGKEAIRSKKRKVGARKVNSENVEEFSQEALDKRTSLAADKVNEYGKSSRRLRKRSGASLLVDEPDGSTEENVDVLAETSNYSLVDEDDQNDVDEEYREETTHHNKTGVKAKTAVQNGKTGRRRKSSSEGKESSSKEPPKKKFPHSTRRNRRQVNKVLLETPEEEIDPRKLPIKDLILLGELKEQRLKKGAATKQNSLPNRSGTNPFAEDAPYDKDDTFLSNDGMNPDDDDDDEAAPYASSSKYNYHSFMEPHKKRKKRWSKEDTERFYEAIREVGTDFQIIETLFPGRDRRDVVLKYKNEERRHPMKLHDALTNRSKDHSEFERLIEKLQVAAQTDQNSDRDMESVGISGEAEDNSPETNEVEKSDQNAEVLSDLATAEVPEDCSPVKSAHESEDDAYKWSPCKSDYDNYVAY